ncbi:CoA-transferase family III, partial [mine drainage metagenome]
PESPLEGMAGGLPGNVPGNEPGNETGGLPGNVLGNGPGNETGGLLGNGPGAFRGPLAGLRVLDLTTLLPGPLATLILVKAGADVIKVERPTGDEMRSYVPRFGPDAVNFALLNRGKRSITVDLKSPEGKERVLALVQDADVLVEQFRPGVLQRLGLHY